MIKAVVFDLDDTLYNEKDFVFGAFKEVSLYLSKKFGLDEPNIYNRMIEIFRDKGRGKIFNIICEENKIDINIDNLVDIYRNATPNILLRKEVTDLLIELREEGYKLGVITDGMAKVQWNKIKQLNIESYVDKIIVTDDYGIKYWKPNSRSYIEMAKHFKLNPSEIIYIGDNPNKDFIGAKEVGYKTLRINTEFSEYIHLQVSCEFDADNRIKDLKSVYDYLNN